MDNDFEYELGEGLIMDTENDFLTDKDNSAISDLSNFDLTTETSDISEANPDSKKKMIKIGAFALAILLLLIGAWTFLMKPSSSAPDMTVAKPSIPEMAVTKKMDQVAGTLDQGGSDDMGSDGQVVAKPGYIAEVGSARLLNREAVDQEMGAAGEAFSSSFSMVEDPSGNGGVILSGIENDSLMDQFGFQNGDVVKSVNDSMLKGDSKVMINELQNSDEVRVKVIRNGKPWKIFLKYK